MRWARDGAEEFHISIRSVKSLLTVTTHVTVVGMVVDPIVVRDSQTTSGAIDAIGTTIPEVAEDAITTVISATMDSGAATGRLEAGILDSLHTHSHTDLPVTLRMWRNWQTRRSQKPVMVTSWRFKSSHPHQEIEASLLIQTRLFSSLITNPPHEIENFCHGFSQSGVLVLRGSVPKGEY
jgi:hypothetical protein